MRWIINNKERWSADSKYKIDWEEESASKEQTIIKNFLKDYWKFDVVFEEYRVPTTLLRVDFINLTRKIAIEHQGRGAHNEYNPFFHRDSRINYLNSLNRDKKKREILENNSFLIIETQTEDLKLLTKKYFEEKFGIKL